LRVPLRGQQHPGCELLKVAVGRRGEISYSLDQMKQMSWSVELSLGD
jgi:hypothetical protein